MFERGTLKKLLTRITSYFICKCKENLQIFVRERYAETLLTKIMAQFT